MRQHIDLAWLKRDAHQAWFAPRLAALQPGLGRVRLHELAWLASSDGGTEPTQADQAGAQVTGVLASAVLELRRYDALLLTVSLETLVWTRRCLAALPKAPVVPIIGVLDGLQSGAMIDLLELGMTDFVLSTVCPQEFRARLIIAVSRAPRYVPLREPSVSFGRPLIDPRNHALSDPRNPVIAHSRAGQEQVAERIAVSHLVWPTIPFQENKQRVISLFEKQYLRALLRRSNGNITEAARLAQKDRRAFWELMRRHGLVSGPRG